MKTNITLYKSIVDTDLSFDYYLDQLIYTKLRFESHLMGSHYLQYYIEQTINNKWYIYQMSPTKQIYPFIAEHFDKSPEVIERTMRHAIERAWENMDLETKKLFFPVVSNHRPTNSNMMYSIYDYIQAYYPFGDDVYYLIDINGTSEMVPIRWIYYQVRFYLHGLLEESYQMNSKFGAQKTQILIDSILLALKTGEVTEYEMMDIIAYLDERYGFYDGILESVDECVELSGALTLLFKMCKQIYKNDETTYPYPKNKNYVKSYLSILSKEARKIFN